MSSRKGPKDATASSRKERQDKLSLFANLGVLCVFVVKKDSEVQCLKRRF